MKRRQLEGMVVVITGASAGIGRSLAEQLARRGARLVLAARRLDRLEDLLKAVGGADRAHLPVQADVSRTDDCRKLVEAAVGHFGRIDTLVCNAGYGLVRTVAATTPAEMRDIFATNVFGTTDLIHAAFPHMLAQPSRDDHPWRGQVMIVSSAAGRRGLPFFGAYSATKFAQLGLAEALRVELAPHRLAVTSVHPVGTRTDFFKTAAVVSRTRLPRKSIIEMHQTADQVAARMLRAIERPRPEVWPLPPARLMLSLATLFPSIADRILSRMRQSLLDAAPADNQQPPVQDHATLNPER